MRKVDRNKNPRGLVSRLAARAGQVRQRVVGATRRAQLGPTNRLDWRLL